MTSLTTFTESARKEFEQHYERTKKLAVLMNVPPEKREKELTSLEKENHDLFIDSITTQLRLLAEGMKEIVPEPRSHMDDVGYPHDDCMHCTVYNDCRTETITNIEKFLK